ncbi:hypothetical protein [Leeuwenhoekiella aequorea]|uniref:Uncharacterized protein n=1 Tax=Leeuwenhoekiella aequorea TaxID=283736 RepID=A0A4Q0PCT3_9FLAO|nr:hypothetical protein [Leeuwenhoekiella aequorea]RXG24575.1 hypothetical protein DSM00_365 [Leeuwenhoekiella aequorea]
MQRLGLLSAFVFCSMLFITCGATPGLTNLSNTVEKDLPIYTYLDSDGNTYVISANKLIYDPASEENTTDGIKDQGYHLELNISLNEYSKIAATCKKQLNISQEDLRAANTDFVIPTLSVQNSTENESVTLSKEGVQDLNYLLKPFLKDE